MLWDASHTLGPGALGELIPLSCRRDCVTWTWPITVSHFLGVILWAYFPEAYEISEMSIRFMTVIFGHNFQ